MYKALKKRGTFISFECTIGWYGKERVDCLTYDTNGIWRCYEIKVSKSDFHSRAKKTFIGHYNYYAMPEKLYVEVKDEIPEHIGVYVDGNLVKRAKRQELGVDEKVLKDSFIRCLYREAEKVLDSSEPTIIEDLKRQLSYQKRQKEKYYQDFWDLKRKVRKLHGED